MPHREDRAVVPERIFDKEVIGGGVAEVASVGVTSRGYAGRLQNPRGVEKAEIAIRRWRSRATL